MKQAGMTSHAERNGVNKQGEVQIEKKLEDERKNKRIKS